MLNSIRAVEGIVSVCLYFERLPPKLIQKNRLLSDKRCFNLDQYRSKAVLNDMKQIAPNNRTSSPVCALGRLCACLLIIVFSLVTYSLPSSIDAPGVSSHKDTLNVTASIQLSLEAGSAQDGDEYDKALVDTPTYSYLHLPTAITLSLRLISSVEAKKWYRPREPPFLL